MSTPAEDKLQKLQCALEKALDYAFDRLGDQAEELSFFCTEEEEASRREACRQAA